MNQYVLLDKGQVIQKAICRRLHFWQHFLIVSTKGGNSIMRSILYLLAVILVIGWLLGVFYWSAGGLIHILIVLAVIALILGIIRRA
jgi:hypothetical protein